MSLLPSTQDHLDFVNIRDDIIILKGGQFRIVIEATAINFDLLSEDEQNSTIFSYATLVNSLDYPLQVVVRTRQIDITDYINYLKSHLRDQPTAALREQLQDYIDFIQQLVLENTVLQKRFFVVVPFYQGGSKDPSQQKSGGSSSSGGGSNSLADLLPGGKKTKVTAKQKIPEEKMAKAKHELGQKFEELKWQFKRLGIKIHRMTTEELIRLYYEIYNPETGNNQGMKDDLFGYTSGMVQNTLRDEKPSE